MSLHEDVAINPWLRYLNAYARKRVMTTEEDCCNSAAVAHAAVETTLLRPSCLA
jgi:hypothetical protein